MKILMNNNDYINKKSKELIPLECEHCFITFYVEKRFIKSNVKRGRTNRHTYCSKKCHNLSKFKRIEKNCKQCNKKISITFYKNEKSKHHFCNSSCAATYNNTHKTKGTRISKLEMWIQSKLTNLYPTLEMHYNKKDTINSELDIYIPVLNLAFELNGIFHYEPIYGDKKLNEIKNNDNRKFQACLEHGIELCIIDTSKIKYLKESKCKEILEIINTIIKTKIGSRGEV
jgi:hypothetical protein